jgi:hypothetical protein
LAERAHINHETSVIAQAIAIPAIKKSIETTPRTTSTIATTSGATRATVARRRLARAA